MKKVLLLFTLFCYFSLYAQTNLATFQFTGNLDPDLVPPPIGEPSIALVSTSSNYYSYSSNRITTGSVPANSYGEGYVVLKIKTKGYSNIGVATVINADGNSCGWQIHANTTGVTPVFSSTGRTGHIRTWEVFPSASWAGATSDILNSGFSNRTDFIYIFFKPYNTSNNTRVINLDNIRITGCKMPDPPLAPANQSFCGSATVSNLTATPTAGHTLSWYNSAGVLLTGSTALSTGTYYVEQIINSGSPDCPAYPSDRTPVSVIVNPIPGAPTGNASQSFCSNLTPTVANLAATGTNVKWYTSSTGGSPLTSTTNLTNGNHYYASQTVNGCESTARLDVTATVNLTPGAPIGNASQSFCSNPTPTVANLAATGTDIKWYTSLTGGSPLASTTTLTNETHYYASQTVNGCESTARLDVTATVNQVSSAGTVSANQSICSGAVATVSVSGSVGALQWQQSSNGSSGWADIPGATLVSYTTPNLIQNTYYRVIAKSGNCSSDTSGVIALTVTDKPSIAAITGPAPLCAGTQLSLTAPVVAANGSPVSQQGWEMSTTAGGATYAALTLPYSVAFSDNGKTIRYTATNSCGTTKSNLVTLTVTDSTNASVVINTSATIICAGTPVTLTATPANGGTPAYQWYRNGALVTGAVNSTYTASDFADNETVYVMMFSNATPCLIGSPATSNILTMKYGDVAVFDDNGWSIDITQIPNLRADIRKDFTTPTGANLYVCSMHVKNNARVKIKSGTSFHVYNDLNVDSSASLTVESDGSLVQVNNNPVINTGIITAQRTLNLSSGRLQYNYISSPVEGQSLKNIYSGIDYVLYHNEANNFFYSSSGAYIKGRGLAVKEPNKTAVPAGNTSVTATFTGYPTNGTFTYGIVNSNISQSKRGFNLIGNPYPSNIDLNVFYTLNGGSSGNLSSTFYFWDNRANSQTVQKGDSYGGQAYAQYNAVSGTGALATGDVNFAGINEPNRIVKMGQAFMVKASGSTQQLTFNNTIRTADNSSVSFFGKSRKSTGAPVDRYWLNLITPGNLASNIAVVYFEGGTNDFAKDDSSSMGGSDVVYSLVGTEKVSINGRSSFAADDVVPLGTSHFEGGNYTLSLNGKEGVFAAGQNIYLKDKQTGLITNLSEGNYTFNANKGESTGRFEIIYRPETVLATDGMVKEEIQVYRDGSFFVVKAQTKKITALELYDAAGRLIEKMQPNNTSVKLNSDAMVTGLYVLKIRQGDEIYVKKIIK